MINLIKKGINIVKDPNHDFSERIFLILTIMSEVMVFVALVFDIIFKETIYEILVIIATLVFVPLVVLLFLQLNRLKIAINIIVLGLVFVILPLMFVFGGGLEGGAVLWFIFAYVYAGMVLKGWWQKVIFAIITILMFACVCFAYFYPQYIYSHTRAMFYVDFVLSLSLVGILCFAMTWAQAVLFVKENERAKKEAEKAEELTRSQNRFFSNMSHEIRTPINSIIGLNELILRDQNASDDIVRDASAIQGSSKLLLALINDILDFSKIEAGSMDIVPVDYKTGDMLSEIVNMMWLRAHDKGLEFNVNIDPAVPTALYGDEVRIKQIIINLLNNAVKYTKEGHVELRVESLEADENTVDLLITVSDTGMGIKKENLPFLFDAFKRVDEEKNRHIEGTGLGLSIVKQLIELMDGDITVNSIYGEGSAFTARIRQVVINKNEIGELNIHNQHIIHRNVYECSFLAPEARILIVDDNELNLMVESRLLEDTDMVIDKALSGKEALEKCVKVRYDTIFMDHLMPGLDGIDCLKALREQVGGLNRNTPVVVLTANAGADNRELYMRAGFDGYLVKPVSGAAMEEVLIKHISRDKIILRNIMMSDDEDIHTSEKYAERLPVIITSSSMSDIPDALVKKLHIPIIPFTITTEDGVFKDGVHIDASELIRHMNAGKDATSGPQSEADYTEFFAEQLRKAHHLIHISLTSSLSKEYKVASEAARAFDNVTVINSECLSSATGILVLIAYKLAQQGMPVKDIVAEIENVKRRLKCSFIIDTTEYMAKKNLISKRLHRFAKALNLHPALSFKHDKTTIGGVWTGRTLRAYRRYIRKAIPVNAKPDKELLFVTYADIPVDTLRWIREEIKKVADFEHVIFLQASAAISSNCGPGTFGLLYFLKSDKSYNLSSLIEEDYTNTGSEEGTAEEDFAVETHEALENFFPNDDEAETSEPNETEPAEPLADTEDTNLSGIDRAAGIKNSGSEDTFLVVLKIFYDSIEDKYAEIEHYYATEDWLNYTTKVHALKSSANLAGALDLSKKAQLLEDAGKAEDLTYIRANHASVMKDYLKLKEILADEFAPSSEENPDAPVADPFLIECTYEGLREAAEAMDYNRIESILKEIEPYAIPEEEKEKLAKIREKADNLDYDGLRDVLK